jgi:hypothetical protein
MHGAKLRLAVVWPSHWPAIVLQEKLSTMMATDTLGHIVAIA